MGGIAAGNLFSQGPILQVSVVEGEGGVHAPGSRLSRPIVVEVTDETGTRLPGVTVSFRLPEEGPSGLFPTGLPETLAVTDAQGRALLRGLQFNKVEGPLSIRVTVAYKGSRAGTVSLQYLAGTTAASGRKSHRNWVLAGLGLAAVGGGLAFAGRGGSSHAPAAQPVAFGIGVPTIVVGKP